MASLGRYFCFCAAVPYQTDREGPDCSVRAERGRPGAQDGVGFGDQKRGRFVETKPAIGFRDVDHQQAEIPRFPQQLPEQRVVLPFNLFRSREDPLAGELLSRPIVKPLFVGEIGSEDAMGPDFREQKPPSPAERFQIGFRAQQPYRRLSGGDDLIAAL